MNTKDVCMYARMAKQRLLIAIQMAEKADNPEVLHDVLRVLSETRELISAAERCARREILR